MKHTVIAIVVVVVALLLAGKGRKEASICPILNKRKYLSTPLVYAKLVKYCKRRQK